MNEKLKSILHKAWNEPRHFFFWLAMFSAWGFAAVVLTICNGELARPASGVILVALGSVLCFVMSTVVFLLAWIPPVRALFSWLLRRRFFVLISMLTLVALFYAIENWRGRHAWQNFKREWEARGERFDVAGIMPPPVPNNQNFFETPLWDDLHFVQTNNVRLGPDTQAGEHVLFDAFGPNASYSPNIANMLKGQRVDLGAWQAFYRGSNHLFSAKGGPATNYFPIAKEPQEPAADVLLALSKFEANRQLLITASARPHARFWLNYDAGSAMLLPHLVRFKSIAQFLSLHSSAALNLGDRATAFEDVKLWLRSIESIRSEPIEISQLVRIAMLHIGLQPVWEGLADRQWTEAELKFIESELGKLDFLSDYHLAMRGERAFSLWGIDYMRKARDLEGAEWFVLPELNPDTPDQRWDTAVLRLIPAGWFDQNKLSLCRTHANVLLPLVDRERRVVPPARNKQLESIIEQRRWRPYDVVSLPMLRPREREAEKFARAQTYADLARLACALERYRLANGHYPEAPDSLSPRFIDKLPHDVINGQPLKYRRTDDGGFVLYSVGWNETDDGGTVELTKMGTVAWNEGDWVWRFPTK